MAWKVFLGDILIFFLCCFALVFLVVNLAYFINTLLDVDSEDLED